jgi:AmmeMemoRadiSam system protein B
MTFSVRPPAVAGTFYPRDSVELRETVDALLQGAAPPSAGPPPKAVIAPHAGYVYSGPIAASAFRALAPPGRKLERIVLLGPSHFVPLDGLALPGSLAFATPLGEVEMDGDGSRASLVLPQVRLMPAAHAREHSLEVELPFLQRLFPGIKVVALVVGRATPEEVADVIEATWGGDETAFVISSDLSHYLPYDEARRVDSRTAEEIVALRSPLASDWACGAAPVNGLLVAARRRGLRAEQIDLRNSGDTAGDRSRVVGYGAFAFRPQA